jgi:hypothetical protein
MTSSSAHSRAFSDYPHTVDVMWSATESWQDQVYFLESWLDCHIGRDQWAWSWHSLKQAFYCGVRFKSAQSLCIFLLSFGDGIAIRSPIIK